MAKISKRTRTKANADTRLKDQQEREFEKPLIGWNVKVVLLFSQLLRENSLSFTIPDNLVVDLRAILNDHYLATADVFAGFPVRQEILSPDNIVDMTKRHIQTAILALISVNIETHANSIVNTTNNDMARAITDARAMQEGDFNQTGFLRMFLRSRVSTRSMTETQFAAEGTRRILDDNTRQELGSNLDNWDSLDADGKKETEELADLSPAVSADDIEQDMSVESAGLIASVLQRNLKQWVTMGDGKVRTSHKFTNGQTVPINQVFIVGSGATLMFPGDGSFGAPIKDLANCRCYCAYL